MSFTTDATVSLTTNTSLTRDWKVISPLNNNHQSIVNQIGVRLSPTLNPGIINRASGFARDGADLVVFNYSDQPQRFTKDLNLSYVDTYQVPYGNPDNTNDTIAFSYGGSVTSTQVAVASYARHVVRVYDRNTGVMQYEIGVPNDPGDVIDNKLYNPRKTLWLPNGNLLVCSYRGLGNGATGEGHISEYNGSTGAFVQTHLAYLQDGEPEIGTNDIYRPLDMDFDLSNANKIWVSVYGRNKVVLVDITNNYDVELIVASQAGFSLTNPWGIAPLSNGNIAVASDASDTILGINPTTQSLEWEIEVLKYGGLGGVRDVIELIPGYIVFCDWNTNVVFVAKIPGNTTIPYSAPTIENGWEVDPNYISPGLDTNGWNYTVDDIDLAGVGDLTVLLRRIT